MVKAANFMGYRYILLQLNKKCVGCEERPGPQLCHAQAGWGVSARHRGSRASPVRLHPSPPPLASSLPPLSSCCTAHIVFRFLEPFLRTRWRHRQMSNIPYLFRVSFASLCEGRERTPRRVLNSFHFELLRG